MAAVRVKPPNPQLLEETIAEWKRRGEIPADSVPHKGLLGWLVDGHVDSVISSGYKFAADQPGISTMLAGTASIVHLETNVRAIEGPPLPKADKRRLQVLSGHIAEYA